MINKTKLANPFLEVHIFFSSIINISLYNYVKEKRT